jgi:hypothetical protein
VLRRALRSHIMGRLLNNLGRLLNKVKAILARLRGNWGKHPRQVAAMQVWLVNIMGRHKVLPHHTTKLQRRVHNKL